MKSFIVNLRQLDESTQVQKITEEVETIKAEPDIMKKGGRLQYLRKVLKDADMPHLIDLAKDESITMAYNELSKERMTEKESLAIPDRFADIEEIKYRLRCKNPHNKELYLYDVMIIGALRPFDLLNMDIYSRGKLFYTNSQGKSHGKEVEVVSLISVPLLIRYMNRCRRWVSEGVVISPLMKTAKDLLKTSYGINYKDLRAIGAYHFCAQMGNVRDKVIGAGRMLRHQPITMAPALHYLHVSD